MGDDAVDKFTNLLKTNRHIIIGTAGHVDHGKTELVKALTGIDTDRLKEEQTRGISIELGFAELVLPGGDRAGLVDVPGHERFVKAMVAGATGVDLGLLVVAADESVMPQTREHLDILALLGVTGGVVVVTKCDLADEETLDVVEAEIEDLLGGTFLEDAPRVRVSARTGQGLDDLRQALATTAAKIPPRVSHQYFRLPVDRVFTLPGVGLVVTGTAWSGEVREGEMLALLPAGTEVRVRGVQVHGDKRDTASAGERIALNLHGVKQSDVERGMLVATPGMLQPSFMLDVRLDVLGSRSRALKNRTRLRIHHGAAEVLGRVVLLDREELEPGDHATAQLRLEKPIAADRGDRIVLRQYSPMQTLGGCKVLDPKPAKHKRYRDDLLDELSRLEKGRPEDLVQEALRRTGITGATVGELETLRLVDARVLRDTLETLVESGAVALLGTIYYDSQAALDARRKIVEIAVEFQRDHPLAWGIGRAELQERLGHRGPKARFGILLEGLVAKPGNGEPLHLRPDTVRVGTPDRELAGPDQEALQKLEKILREAGAAPPLIADLKQELGIGARLPAFVSLLEEGGTIVKVTESLLYHKSALDDVESKLRSFFASHERMTMADFKSLTSLSRKYAVPLLEHFDRQGLSRRDGDYRLPGPRLDARG